MPSLNLEMLRARIATSQSAFPRLFCVAGHSGKARKGVISPRGAVLGMAMPRPKLARLVVPERGKIQPKHRPQLGLKAPEQANTQAASSGDF